MTPSFLFILLAVGPQAPGQELAPAFRYAPDSVTLSGFSPEQVADLKQAQAEGTPWAKLLAVFLDPRAEKNDQRQAILGSYRLGKDALTFRPAFPFYPGTQHLVTLSLNDRQKHWRFTIPKPVRTPTAGVAQITPAAPVLPSNILKFYLTFNEPMGRGETLQHITLLDEAGKPVHAPFLDVKPELWTPDNTRFTLLFDPGRIKRGIAPNATDGPPLLPHRRYTLVVSRNMPNARGVSMIEDWRHSFSTSDPDRTRPNWRNWRVNKPSVGSLEPLELILDEPMDVALMQRMIGLEHARDALPQGEITIAQNEHIWRYRPTSSWPEGDYVIHINPIIEDRAGNQLFRLFDVDMRADDVAKDQTPPKISFSLKP